jgi:hypothetical protein
MVIVRIWLFFPVSQMNSPGSVIGFYY